MKISSFFAFAGPTLLSLALFTPGAPCIAQERQAEKPPAEPGVSSWYYEPAAKAAPQRSIAQQKAIARGEQRMQRMAAAKSFGYSPSRPNMTGGSFATMYSGSWSHGRSYGWFVSLRPTIIITPSATSYR